MGRVNAHNTVPIYINRDTHKKPREPSMACSAADLELRSFPLQSLESLPLAHSLPFSVTLWFVSRLVSRFSVKINKRLAFALYVPKHHRSLRFARTLEISPRCFVLRCVCVCVYVYAARPTSHRSPQSSGATIAQKGLLTSVTSASRTHIRSTPGPALTKQLYIHVHTHTAIGESSFW